MSFENPNFDFTTEREKSLKEIKEDIKKNTEEKLKRQISDNIISQLWSKDGLEVKKGDTIGHINSLTQKGNRINYTSDGNSDFKDNYDVDNIMVGDTLRIKEENGVKSLYVFRENIGEEFLLTSDISGYDKITSPKTEESNKKNNTEKQTASEAPQKDNAEKQTTSEAPQKDNAEKQTTSEAPQKDNADTQPTAVNNQQNSPQTANDIIGGNVEITKETETTVDGAFSSQNIDKNMRAYDSYGVMIDGELVEIGDLKEKQREKLEKESMFIQNTAWQLKTILDFTISRAHAENNFSDDELAVFNYRVYELVREMGTCVSGLTNSDGSINTDLTNIRNFLTIQLKGFSNDFESSWTRDNVEDEAFDNAYKQINLSKISLEYTTEKSKYEEKLKIYNVSFLEKFREGVFQDGDSDKVMEYVLPGALAEISKDTDSNYSKVLLNLDKNLETNNYKKDIAELGLKKDLNEVEQEIHDQFGFDKTSQLRAYYLENQTSLKELGIENQNQYVDYIKNQSRKEAIKILIAKEHGKKQGNGSFNSYSKFLGEIQGDKTNKMIAEVGISIALTAIPGLGTSMLAAKGLSTVAKIGMVSNLAGKTGKLGTAINLSGRALKGATIGGSFYAGGNLGTTAIENGGSFDEFFSNYGESFKIEELGKESVAMAVGVTLFPTLGSLLGMSNFVKGLMQTPKFTKFANHKASEVIGEAVAYSIASGAYDKVILEKDLSKEELLATLTQDLVFGGLMSATGRFVKLKKRPQDAGNIETKRKNKGDLENTKTPKEVDKTPLTKEEIKDGLEDAISNLDDKTLKGAKPAIEKRVRNDIDKGNYTTSDGTKITVDENNFIIKKTDRTEIKVPKGEENKVPDEVMKEIPSKERASMISQEVFNISSGKVKYVYLNGEKTIMVQDGVKTKFINFRTGKEVSGEINITPKDLKNTFNAKIDQQIDIVEELRQKLLAGNLSNLDKVKMNGLFEMAGIKNVNDIINHDLVLGNLIKSLKTTKDLGVKGVLEKMNPAKLETYKNAGAGLWNNKGGILKWSMYGSVINGGDIMLNEEHNYVGIVPNSGLTGNDIVDGAIDTASIMALPLIYRTTGPILTLASMTNILPDDE